MKPIQMFFVSSVLFLSSCGLLIEEPSACMNISPSTTVEVFEVVTLNSCSQDAESIEWEVEQPLQGSISKKGQSTTTSWGQPGTYLIRITAISEKDKYEDETSQNVTVEDVCYTCTYSFDILGQIYSSESEHCYSESVSKDSFDDMIEDFRSEGYTCRRN